MPKVAGKPRRCFIAARLSTGMNASPLVKTAGLVHVTGFAFMRQTAGSAQSFSTFQNTIESGTLIKFLRLTRIADGLFHTPQGIYITSSVARTWICCATFLRASRVVASAHWLRSSSSLGSQGQPHQALSHPADVEILNAGFEASRPPFEVKKMLHPPCPAGSFLVRLVTSVPQSMVSSWTLTPALLSASEKTRSAAWKAG